MSALIGARNVLGSAAASLQGYLGDGANGPADINPRTGKGPEWGEAAPIGLLVIVLLCIGVYFLIKSMNRNLRKVPVSFASPAQAAVSAGAVGAGAVGAGTVVASAAETRPAVVDSDTTSSASPAATDPLA